MTTKILFEDVVRAIEKYGFIKNKNPVLISIELHCEEEQITELANILYNVFEDKLYTLPQNWKYLNNFPSPHELLGKFIVKCGGSIEKADLFFRIYPKLNKP
jgi:hypothetical protein